MAEKRPPAWKHPEGDEATAVCLAACLDVQLIVDKNVDLYKSIDMKSGLSQQGLLDSKVMLKSLLEVDPRGGYFLQVDMVRAATRKFLQARASPNAWR